VVPALRISRAPGCSLEGAIRAVQHRRYIHQRATELTAAAKPVRQEGGLDLFITPLGPFWVSQGDYLREFFGTIAEMEVDQYGKGEPHPGDVVLDCGANYGIYTRKALRDGAKLVVSIEPEPTLITCLRRTFEKEIARGRVIVVPKGVWDHEDTLVLHRIPQRPWGDSFLPAEGAQSSVEAPLSTIDRIVSELGLSRVDFIKMDIEGAEERALVGAQQTIRRFHPRMAVCVYHQPSDPERIPALVRQYAPSYRLECPCKEWYGKIIPDVALFRR
jgi:FkbM family methyltransferase